MSILVFNAGSASLKFEVIQADSSIINPNQGRKLVSGIIEQIGKEPVLLQLKDKQVIAQQSLAAQDYEAAKYCALEWLDTQPHVATTTELDLVGHRVVHGSDHFTAATKIDDEVIDKIEALEELAPLHNQPAVSVIRASHNKSDILMVAVFDTVFHRSIPDRAKLYAILPDLAKRHKIYRYGFHNISH